MTSSLSNQIQQWSQIQQEWQETNAEYKQGLASLINWMKQDPSHRAGEALWRFQMWLMPDATQSCELQTAMEADALNIANAIRNDITNAQNAYNQVIQDIESKAGITKGQNDTSKLMSAMKALDKALDTPGMTKIIGKSGIDNMKNWITSINQNLHGPSWSWLSGPFYDYRNLQNAWNQATEGGQSVPPLFTNITSGFNNLNQSVSGISSTIQANMQYLNNNLQQLFGIFKSFFDDFSQLSTYIVQKSSNQ